MIRLLSARLCCATIAQTAQQLNTADSAGDIAPPAAYGHVPLAVAHHKASAAPPAYGGDLFDGRCTAHAGKLASFPRDVTEPLLDQPDNFVLLPEVQQPKAPTQRDGIFQRISGTTTYLPRFGDHSVGFEDTEVYGVFGLPCPTRDRPLLIEPGRISGSSMRRKVSICQRRCTTTIWNSIGSANSPSAGCRPDGHARLAQRLSQFQRLAGVPRRSPWRRSLRLVSRN